MVGLHHLQLQPQLRGPGRQGGIDRAIVGGHTYGFNSETTSVAQVGDFQQTSQAVRFADMIPDVINGRPVALDIQLEDNVKAALARDQAVFIVTRFRDD